MLRTKFTKLTEKSKNKIKIEFSIFGTKKQKMLSVEKHLATQTIQPFVRVENPIQLKLVRRQEKLPRLPTDLKNYIKKYVEFKCVYNSKKCIEIQKKGHFDRCNCETKHWSCVRVRCGCGACFQYQNLKRHNKTNRHRAYVLTTVQNSQKK